MDLRPTMGRWDVLNPTNAQTVILLGFALSVYHRPFLPLILPSYAAFDDLMPWAYWGWAAAVIALLLQATPRTSGWRVLAHALTGLYWLGVITVFTSEVGVTSAATTYFYLLIQSVALFARTGTRWQSERGWWQHLVKHPPRWLRKLARIEEYERARKR